MGQFAMTTGGPVAAADLGLLLPHEHLLFDSSGWITTPLDEHETWLASQGLTLETSADLRRTPMISRENLIFTDEQLSAYEVGLFREAGGGTIVDCTLPEMKRNVAAVHRIAQAAGVHIIAATGHYVAQMHAPEVSRQTMEEVAAWMVDELRNGIDGTGIRAGVIKIGLTSVPRMPPDERKCLEAAGAAQRETGAPITMHNPPPFEKRGVEVLRILTRAGADPEKVIMGHMTHTVPDIHYHKSLMDLGAVVEFDRFGQELYQEAWDTANRWGLYAGEPRDSEVVNEIVTLVRDGYVDRILMSHDIGFRNSLRTYGGFGYAHIPYRITRYLRQQGLDDADIEQLTVLTPARLFAYLPDA
jgi:phosphotriesterase-related protein